jgi:hypothetical protein
MTATYRAALMLLGLAVFLVWTFMLVHSVRLEERAATRAEIMLDSDGRPVEIIWQIGKGYRLPTQEEQDHAKRED